MDIVRYFGSDEWSALYVDGKLDRVGDHYIIDERISALVQVDTRYSDAFLQGGTTREEVARTLSEAEAYEGELSAKEARKAELEAQKARLEAELAALG